MRTRFLARQRTHSEALDKLDSATWDVMLLDLTMPGRGSSGCAGAGADHPSRAQKSLVLTMHPADQYAVRVLKAGAAGYLTKGERLG